ncbi:transglutaminase family protein [Sphingomonas donggukensis]|uniref:Transglutaminase family protein n=1 Tax=Sphingomonas donggukensis TaxID=2949093 RepID=A0ABY4TZH7_9SPHN|nr:transglutaminase family protein [Sphingomonas donggukensis]URW75951.1 transglutaminase family protein [Sphingomonas donggukensis]
MSIQIDARLSYDFAETSDILLQVEAAMIPEQVVRDARIDISPVEHFARVSGHDMIGDRIWLRLRGRLTVDYRATVTPQRIVADLAGLAATPFHMLPGEAVQYLMASRYCQSDLFEEFVTAEFEHLCGGERIAAIRDWIERNFSYEAGTSASFTTAMESFVQRKGVCRDYSHVMITLARAAGVPARIASVYALGVDPQDFHAVAEVFLDGAWHLVDPTGMARAEDMAKIGVGRDAADVAFLTSYGNAVFCEQRVRVSAVSEA